MNPILPNDDDHIVFSQEEKSSKPQHSSPFSWKNIIDIVANLVLIAIVVIVIRSFIIAPFQVSGASMTNTLEDQEYILVNKFTYQSIFGYQIGAPERGDIVVLEPPISQQKYYIKRIIGLPGDTVSFEERAVRIKNQQYPQGFILEEPYARCMEIKDGKTENHCDYSELIHKEFTVPSGHYFVMGDNRGNSTDSRVCFYSCSIPEATPYVEQKHIIGKTWFVFRPLTHLRAISHQEYSQDSN